MSKHTRNRLSVPRTSTIIIVAGLLCVTISAILWMKSLLSTYDMVPGMACPDVAACSAQLHRIEISLKVYWIGVITGTLLSAVGFFIRNRPKRHIKKPHN